MAMDVTGRVVKKYQVENGTGKTGNAWSKQTFVIETEENYPKKIAFQAWGDKVQIVAGLREGDKVKVSFDVACREYQDKWYTDLRPWKIESAGGSSPDMEPSQERPAQEDTYFESSDSGDDLPF